MLMYGNCQRGPREAELIGNVEEGIHVGRARQNLPALRIRLALMDRDFDDLDYEDLRALDDDITQDPPSTGEGAYNDRYMVQSHVHTRRIQGNELACIVCLEQFSVGELIRSLPCLHQLHTSMVATTRNAPFVSAVQVQRHRKMVGKHVQASGCRCMQLKKMVVVRSGRKVMTFFLSILFVFFPSAIWKR